MTKTIRTVKASIIMGVFMISLFAVLIPSASAGIFKSTAQLKVELENPDQSTFIPPLEGEMRIPLRVGIYVVGLFAPATINRFKNVLPAQISLSVEETPSYCTATIQPNVVSPQLSSGWSYDTSADLLVSFKENAPAVGPVAIKIKLQSIDLNALLFEVKPSTYYSSITFTPSFRPIISVTPEVSGVETSPGKLTEIPIDLTNLGNADTEFILSVNDLPNGWVASLPANIIVPSSANGGNSKLTVMLDVTPPYGFGYHDETVKIGLSVYGQYFAGSGSTVNNATILKTSVYTPTITIKSRGFSTPGFESVFVIFAIVGIALILRMKQKRRKN